MVITKSSLWTLQFFAERPRYRLRYVFNMMIVNMSKNIVLDKNVLLLLT